MKDQIFATAGLGKRALARWLDGFIEGLLFVPLMISTSHEFLTQGQIQVRLDWLVICAFLVFLYRLSFLYFLGATLGKRILGLKLVAVSGKDLQFSQVLIRLVADQLSLFFGYGLYALAFFRFDRRHLSDFLAETRVVIQKPSAQDLGNFFPRRWVLGLFLVIAFSAAGFTSVQQSLKNWRLEASRLILRT